ncbi:MAG: sugar phosphate nucleotidyltransferase [Alphaproteobacteria bacterium]
MQAIDKIIPVILCGGQGARLRAVSNADFPKQFHCDEAGKSLLSLTLQRVLAPEIFSAPMLFVNVLYKAAIEAGVAEAQARSSSALRPHIILEPFRRNTLAPILLAAMLARRLGMGAKRYILALPSDHIIEDIQAFQDDMRKGFAVLRAESGGDGDAGEGAQAGIVYFGLPPLSPSSEYGYVIERDAGGVEFHEKPETYEAQSLIEQGAQWNSGIFLLDTDIFLRQAAQISGEVYALAEAVTEQCLTQEGAELAELVVLEAGAGAGMLSVIAAELFGRFPAIAFDRFYCEKTSAGRVLRASFDWCDIGSIEIYQAKGLRG